MSRTLLRKELLEQRRTFRLLITLAVFFISGLMSPIIAKYLPVLLSSIPNVPGGLAGLIPEPTVNDAIAQYIKNVSQFGVLLVLVMTMGSMASEKERGTAAMLLSKPVRRSAVILAKWLAGMSSVLLGLAISALCCYGYTYLLFGPLPLGKFVALNGLMALFLGFYLTLALLASSLARSQAIAAGATFGGLALFLILDSMPVVGDSMPGELLAWGQAMLAGMSKTAWSALGVTIGLIALFLIIAIMYFNREEI